jgi:hypothetical protein
VVSKPSPVVVDVEDFHTGDSNGERDGQFKSLVSDLLAKGSGRFGEIAVGEKDLALFVGIGDVALFAFGPLGKISTIGCQLDICTTTGAGEAELRSGFGNGHVEK